MLSEITVSAAFLESCKAELRALKPGNIHDYADGHEWTVADFERSADAAAMPLAMAHGVGPRVLAAVKATLAAVGYNSNLGIVLMSAPLVEAALTCGENAFQARVCRVLHDLSLDDADAAFQAIAMANPGGLGDAAAHDVRDAARTTLLEAMRHAEGHDRIAWNYANAFHDVFGLGHQRLAEAKARGLLGPQATSWVFLGFAAAFPDSHIIRKHGSHMAENVRQRFILAERHARAARNWEDMVPELLDLDASLKADHLNPGTSADFTVATLLSQRLSAMVPAAGSGLIEKTDQNNVDF